MRTYQQLEKRVQVLFKCPFIISMDEMYIILENIGIWFSTPLVLSMETMYMKHLQKRMKGTIYLENMLIRLECF